MPNPETELEPVLEPMLPEFLPEAEPAPEQVEPTEPNEPAAASPAAAPRLLNQEAKTPEEILAYAAKLERQQIESEAKLSVFQSGLGQTPASTPAAPQTVVPTDKELNEKYAARMFSEPATVLKEFAQDIEKRLEAKNAKSTEEKTFWSSFYEEFSDLTGLDDIVQLQLYKNQEQWKKVPVSQARKLLASASRQYVEKIRDLKTPTETLPSGPAATVGATRGSAPRVSVPEESLSFIDQVRKVNRKQAV